MKFVCSICGDDFDDIEECRVHENCHKADVIWQQVHLTRKNGRWTFTFSQSRLGQLAADIPAPEKIHRNAVPNKDWPMWWAACRNTDEAVKETKRRLLQAAIEWYQSRVDELIGKWQAEEI